MKEMATTPIKSIFVCTGCAEMAMTRPIVLAGLKYCGLCTEERQDELAIAVRERLRRGPLRWGRHYLSMTQHPVKAELVTADDVVANEIAARILGEKHVPMERGFFTLDIVCYCGNANHSHLNLFRSYGQFWQEFAAFCNWHYDQLIRLVKP